jgi:hypothetical protein
VATILIILPALVRAVTVLLERGGATGEADPDA